MKYVVGKWLFLVAVAVVGVILTFNWTPFRAPPDISMSDPTWRKSPYGAEYMANRRRFHIKLFVVLAVCYLLQFVV